MGDRRTDHCGWHVRGVSVAQQAGRAEALRSPRRSHMKGIALVIGLIAAVAVSLVIFEAYRDQPDDIPSGPDTSVITTPSTTTGPALSPSAGPTVVLPPGGAVVVTQQPLVTQPAPPGPLGPPGEAGPPGPPPPEEDDGIVDKLRDMLGL